jgi:hypothetical protein
MKLNTLIFCMVFWGTATAQKESDINQKAWSDFTYGTKLELKGTDGRPLLGKNYDPEIKGSPYWNDEWLLCDLQFTNGLYLRQLKTKFDLAANAIYYLDSMNNSFVIYPEAITQIEYNLNAAGQHTIFRRGFPAIDKQGLNHYYKVLSDGKMILLKFLKKEISILKNDMTGDVSKEFADYENYYTYFNGEMRVVKKAKSFFLDIMVDKKEVVEKYINEKPINFKHMEDITKLIDYYNTLK